LALTTADGREIEAAAVIAADGLRSRLRAQLHPGDEPRDTGYVAHRTIVPMADAPALARQRDGVTMWSGDGFHVIYYPLRDRTELNIVLVVRVPPGVDTASAAYRDHLARIMDRAQPEPREVIARVSLERRWGIADREPIRRWADGRVTLLGDAAHATLQSLAQGAGMALEDAGTLARILAEEGEDYAAAFQRLQRERFLRTARVQLVSRGLWQEFHCDGVAAQVRTAEWGERGAEDFYRCLDWLWRAPAPDRHDR
jgi:salicylate hydroxylase